MRQLPPAAAPGLRQYRDAVDIKPDWLAKLPADPIQAIIRSKHSGAGLRLLALLVDNWRTPSRRLRSQLRRLAMESSPVTAVKRRQRQDGSWPSGGDQVPSKENRQLDYITLLENLHALSQSGATHGWPVVKRGLRHLLLHQQPDGRFPGLYHHHAATGGLLLALGLATSPAVHRAAHWIGERQRPDGGWLHPHMPTKRSASCIWTTAEVLAFLTRYPSMTLKETFPAAAEFLLERALQPNTTPLLPTADAWNRFATGSRGESLFRGGTLKVLESLARAGFPPADGRFRKLYDWLINTQLPDGLFPAAAGRPEGDPLVTVAVLELINRVESTRPPGHKAKSADSGLISGQIDRSDEA